MKRGPMLIYQIPTSTNCMQCCLSQCPPPCLFILQGYSNTSCSHYCIQGQAFWLISVSKWTFWCMRFLELTIQLMEGRWKLKGALVLGSKWFEKCGDNKYLILKFQKEEEEEKGNNSWGGWSMGGRSLRKKDEERNLKQNRKLRFSRERGSCFKEKQMEK